jgi:hypothetical protein
MEFKKDVKTRRVSGGGSGETGEKFSGEALIFEIAQEVWERTRQKDTKSAVILRKDVLMLMPGDDNGRIKRSPPSRATEV